MCIQECVFTHAHMLSVSVALLWFSESCRNRVVPFQTDARLNIFWFDSDQSYGDLFYLCVFVKFDKYDFSQVLFFSLTTLVLRAQKYNGVLWHVCVCLV